VATVGAVIVHFVGMGWIENREGAVGVRTVQAFLVAVDHGFPVEVAWVFDAAAVGETAEVVFVEEFE